MRDAFVEKLTELAENDPSIMFITADLGFGVFTEYAKRFPKQYLNVGVAEQNMTGVATGLALEGRTIFTYSIANFATLRCLEQIRNDAAYHNANITIVSSGGGFTYGSLGMSHHATEDIAIMRALPNIAVVAPGTAWETRYATEQLTQRPGVGYLRIEKGGNKEPHWAECQFELGKAITVKNGNDITLISTGGILTESILAAEKLSAQGISARVISMHTVKPIDRAAIIKAAKETKAIVTVEEHNILGGLGSAVAEVLTLEDVPKIKFGQIGLKDQYSSVVGDQGYLRSFYQLDHTSIVNKVLSLIGKTIPAESLRETII
ncbi:transketolase subunit B [Oleiphilus messinensis]|uniref:Transketolase subunit B n=1 Tax=Oleiphilus messinensis TaxID=141451 RepID=A0A1Y0IJI9_9GAMM|nr:transketolase C-terminal domain-containing protein [Oleiphilus messinensis]ARU59554.1 transketolase subunit B [Oleiphilus messinensis]